MAGEFKVNGVSFATESGGTLTVNNSKVRLPSSGNGIEDSSGNSVISESSGTVNITRGTVGSAVSLATATFPAGHIIQTTQTTYNSANSQTTNLTSPSKCVDGSGNNHWKHTISNMKAGNDVLIQMGFTIHITKTGTFNGGAFHIYRDNTLIYTIVGSNSGTFVEIGNGSGVTHKSYVFPTFLDTGATGTSHTYFLGISSQGSSTVHIQSSSTDPPFICLLQELST